MGNFFRDAGRAIARGSANFNRIRRDIFGADAPVAILPTGEPFIAPSANQLRDFTLSAGEWAQEQAAPFAQDIAELYGYEDISQKLPWEGGVYYPNRVGYAIEYGYDAGLSDLLGSPVTGADTRAKTYFVGHLPDCSFDELSITNTGGDYRDDEDKIDLNQFVGAYVYQINHGQIDGLPSVIAVSGIETGVDAQEPSKIYRLALKLPWKSRRRASETYGGPVYSQLPTFVRLFVGPGIDGLTPTVADWAMQITVRFIVQRTL